jgi:3-methyladenine DNA glycosylase/8-oxoguanine DNA glycosylase
MVEPVPVRLEFTPPYDVDLTLAILAAHAIPGTEVVDPVTRRYTRVMSTGAGPTEATITFAADHVLVEVDTVIAPHIALITHDIRGWLDLDADLAGVRRTLGNDRLLSSSLLAHPGLRVIGHPSGFEAAIMTVLGQQVSVAAGRTFGARLVAAYGEPTRSGLTAFPTAERLAATTPIELQHAVGVTGVRARTLHALAEVCAAGLFIDPDGDHGDIRCRLLAVHGIGPWTVDYLAVRVLGDRNAFPAGDLVIRRALGGMSTKSAIEASSRWAPYRAYAAFHLWALAGYDRRTQLTP